MIAIILTVMQLGAGPLAAKEDESIPYNFKGLSRVIAIGDLHGDVNALISILLDKKLISDEGQWIGGEADVVIVGDWAGETKKKTRKILDYLLHLEGISMQRGGRIHTLMGNADQKAVLSWKFLEKEPYVSWLTTRNAIIQIDTDLFGHAGIDYWGKKKKERKLQRINSKVRDWLRYHLTSGDKPRKKTGWIFKDKPIKLFGRKIKGPLWTRIYKIHSLEEDKKPKNAPSRKELLELLKENKAKRIFTGHNPTPDSLILDKHPYYGKMIISLDSRISDKKRGRLSSIEISRGQLQRKYSERSPNCVRILESIGTD